MGFYIKVLQFELEEDREGTLADLAHVVYHFKMPGVGLIPEYDQRLGVDGVGINSQQFLQRGIFPLLKAVGTSRQELVRLLHKNKVMDMPKEDISSNKVAMPVAG
jgi:acyl-[acyl-carrier-protein] desaturase